MSIRSRTFRLFVRFYANELVDAIYDGALARVAGSPTRKEYAGVLKKTRELSNVLHDVLNSEEFRQKSLATLAPDLVGSLFQGLLERDPEPEARAAYSAAVEQTAGLSAVASAIIRSEEFRSRSFAGLAPSLIRSTFQALLGREPEQQAALHYGKTLAGSADLGNLLAEIVRSEEFRRASLAAFAPEWLRALLRSLLGREPEPEAVAAYCKSLMVSGDFKATADAIVRSEEYKKTRSLGTAAELVRAIFRGLLGREPGSQTLSLYGDTLENKGDVSEIITQILETEEYRKGSIAVLAQDLVRAIFEGLLDRPPDSAAVAYYQKRLSEGREIAPLLAEIIRSEEFAKKYSLKAPPRLYKTIRAKQRDGASFSTQDLQIPKLVFVHHPKSGGTTLHHILVKAFERDEICPERFNALQHHSAGELARYRFFSGHFDLPSVRLIPGRKKIVTLLREPVARLISLYYFQRAHRPEIIEKNGLELARLANAYRMREFFLAPEIRLHPAINNSLTRILVDTLEGVRWEQDARVDVGDSDQYVQLAIRELSSIDAFGLMERYKDSVELICESVGLDVPKEIESRQVFDVITAEEPGLRKIAKEPVTDEIKELIASLVRTDQKVYARACVLFEERLATLRRRSSAMRTHYDGYDSGSSVQQGAVTKADSN